MRVFRSFIKEPLLHFLLIGAGLFLLYGWRGGLETLPATRQDPKSEKIVVSRDDVDRMLETYTRTWQRPPTNEELDGLIDSYVRDEIYYREARAIGLDREDSIIRRRMRQQMEFIFEDISAQVEPTDEEMISYMKKYPERYCLDPQVSFRHVFIAVDQTEESARLEARQVLARLTAGVNPDEVGDPFPAGPMIGLSPLWDIRTLFGEGFATGLLDQEPGRWTGPVRSAYGLHLVFVNEILESRFPEFEEIRGMVKRDLMAERQQEIKDAAYAKLRESYTIIVEKSKAENGMAAAGAAE